MLFLDSYADSYIGELKLLYLQTDFFAEDHDIIVLSTKSR